MMSRKKIFLSFVFSVFLSSGNNSVAKKNVSEMTSDEKIGQMIMLSFRKWKQKGDEEDKPVTCMNDEISSIVKNYHVGNIILYAENFSGKDQSKKLVEDFKNLSGDIPMLVSTDQEGGRVQRIKFGTDYKDNIDIKNEDEAYQKGKEIAEELKDIGINCDLAPVADVNSNSKNEVIGARSFGSDPYIVSELCVSFLKGLHEHGILGTAKHFPGHGDTSKDSHYELPEVSKTEEELEKCEFIPFMSLIDGGIDMIMTAHILLPKIDDKYPATLSEKILNGILRDKLGYNGVVITDSMNMGAIKRFIENNASTSENSKNTKDSTCIDKYDKYDACILAINAGADILCMPVEDINELECFYSYLKKKIKSNKQFSDRVDESVARILELKEKIRDN